jgi:hypothetical protein
MGKRVVITDLSDVAYEWLLAFVAMLSVKLGEQPVVADQTPGVGTAKVSYHAIAGADALAMIGTNRVDALIYARLLNAPCTTVELRQEMPSSNNKAIQSALYRLRASGFVESRDIG